MTEHGAAGQPAIEISYRAPGELLRIMNFPLARRFCAITNLPFGANYLNLKFSGSIMLLYHSSFVSCKPGLTIFYSRALQSVLTSSSGPVPDETVVFSANNDQLVTTTNVRLRVIFLPTR